MIGSRFFPAVGRVPTWSFTCHQMKKCQPELTCQYHGRADHIRTASAYSCFIYNKSVPSSSSSSSSSSLPSSSNSPLHSAALQSSRWCSSSINSAQREPSGLLECSDEKTQEIAERDFIVIQDFITKDEEESLLREAERFLKKVRYEYDHWDNAIHGFRETEKSRWSEVNSPIIQRIRDQAFPAGSSQLSLVHVLDLAQNGYIKPHVDSVKYCGSTIAGLCLLSPAVMRLVHTENSNQWVNALLNSRSLYIMRDNMRYDYTHEILKDEESIFRGNPVPRGRRISIMCRAEVSRSS